MVYIVHNVYIAKRVLQAGDHMLSHIPREELITLGLYQAFCHASKSKVTRGP